MLALRARTVCHDMRATSGQVHVFRFVCHCLLDWTGTVFMRRALQNASKHKHSIRTWRNWALEYHDDVLQCIWAVCIRIIGTLSARDHLFGSILGACARVQVNNRTIGVACHEFVLHDVPRRIWEHCCLSVLVIYHAVVLMSVSNLAQCHSLFERSVAQYLPTCSV